MASDKVLQEMKNFVTRYPLGVLATVDARNIPHSAAIYLGSDEAFNLFFTTKTHTLKHENIQYNPHISVVFLNEQTQSTLQVQGIATPVANTTEANTASEIIRSISTKSDDWMPPLSKINAGNYEFYKITVLNAKLRYFGNKSKGESPNEWEYNTYESSNPPSATI